MGAGGRSAKLNPFTNKKKSKKNPKKKKKNHSGALGIPRKPAMACVVFETGSDKYMEAFFFLGGGGVRVLKRHRSTERLALATEKMDFRGEPLSKTT